MTQAFLLTVHNCGALWAFKLYIKNHTFSSPLFQFK
jgi:hypothetical protein